MLSTTVSINIDLQRPSIIVIHAKQFDALSRFAEIHLFSCGEPWSIDKSNNDKKEYAYAVQYRKPDGTKGLYDKLPDGVTDAVTESLAPSGETVLRVRFAPQMFTVAGNVKCSVAIMQTGDGTKLQTCSFDVLVAASEVSGDESKDYYKMVTLEGLQNQIGDLDGLATDAKSDLVAAINEVLGKLPAYFVTSVAGMTGDVTLDAANIAANVDGIPADNVAVALAYLLYTFNRLDDTQIRATLDGTDVATVRDALAYLQDLAKQYVVNMTKNADGAYTADKTFAALKAAHDAGKTVICSFKDLTRQWDVPVRLPLVYLGDTYMGFAAVVDQEQGNMVYLWAYINNGGMGHTATEIATEEMTEAYVVNMTKNADGTYTADKTFAALKAAHDAGKTVICSFQDLTQQWDVPVRLPVVDTTDVHMGFAGVIEPRQNYKIFAYVYINSGGMGHTATEIATNDTVSTMIAAAIGDTATALSDMDSVIGGAGA